MSIVPSLAHISSRRSQWWVITPDNEWVKSRGRFRIKAHIHAVSTTLQTGIQIGRLWAVQWFDTVCNNHSIDHDTRTWELGKAGGVFLPQYWSVLKMTPSTDGLIYVSLLDGANESTTTTLLYTTVPSLACLCYHFCFSRLPMWFILLFFTLCLWDIPGSVSMEASERMPWEGGDRWLPHAGASVFGCHGKTIGRITSGRPAVTTRTTTSTQGTIADWFCWAVRQIAIAHSRPTSLTFHVYHLLTFQPWRSGQLTFDHVPFQRSSLFTSYQRGSLSVSPSPHPLPLFIHTQHFISFFNFFICCLPFDQTSAHFKWNALLCKSDHAFTQ